jgi:hypothetical protein
MLRIVIGLAFLLFNMSESYSQECHALYVTVTGQIQKVEELNDRTFIQIQDRKCGSLDIVFKGRPPQGCVAGKRATATGRVFFEITGDELDADKVQCK